MRNSLFAITISFLVIACHTNSDNKPIFNTATLQAAAATYTPSNKYAKLLAQFPVIHFDTLALVPPEEDSSRRFKGRDIDSSYWSLLPADMYHAEEVGAISQFAIDSNSVGLLIRRMGEYSYSSLVLMVYNRKTDKITEWTELANEEGDEGSVRTIKSWLFTSPQHRMQTLQWIHDTELDLDNDTLSYVSDHYSLFNIAPYNTISADSMLLQKRYGHLFKD